MVGEEGVNSSPWLPQCESWDLLYRATFAAVPNITWVEHGPAENFNLLVAGPNFAMVSVVVSTCQYAEK
jgi:hypothetical protein